MRFLILFLILAAQGWGATFYVDSVNGNDTYNGSSPTYVSGVIGPKKTLQAAFTAGGNDAIVRPLPGVHAVDNLNPVNLRQQLVGYGAGVSIIDGGTASETATVRWESTNGVIRDVTIRNGAGYCIQMRAAGLVIEDAIIEGGATGDARPALYSSAAATIRRSIVRNRSGLNKLYGANTFENCLFYNLGQIRMYDDVAPMEVKFLNCTMVGVGGGGPGFLIAAGDPGVDAYFTNCAMSATPAIETSFFAPVVNDVATNTVKLTNCKLSASIYALGRAWAINIIFENVTYSAPMFRSPRRPSVVVLMIDDTINFDHWENLSAIANAKGFPVTLAVNTSPISIAAVENFWTRLTAKVALGNGVASHGKTGSLALNDPEVMNLASTLTTPTVSVSVADDYLKIFSAGVEEYSITLAGKTISEVITELSALANVTATLHSSGDNPTVYATNLADIAAVDISGAGATLSLDWDRWAADEIVGPKTTIEANLPGYTVKGFVYPRNRWGAEAIARVKAAGYIGAGGVGVSSPRMENLSIYEISRIAVTDDGEEGLIHHDSIAKDVASLTEWISFHGGIYVIYGHGASVFSLSYWTELLDELKKSHVQVMTYNDAIDYVIANGTTADDGLTYTRTFTDAPDYHLSPRSPLINAGVDVGLTTDIEGKAIRGLPDIGAYEWQGDFEGGAIRRFIFRLFRR